MKKTNKKGFTLVELLAVIVILAVLILIALPNVMNIMNNARNNAFKDEAAAFISAAENQYMSEEGSGCKLYSYDYSGNNNNAAIGSATQLTSMKKKNGYSAVVKIDGDNAWITISDGKKSLTNRTKEEAANKSTALDETAKTAITTANQEVSCP